MPRPSTHSDLQALPYRDQIIIAIAEASESERLELAMYFIDRLTEVETDRQAVKRLGFQQETLSAHLALRARKPFLFTSAI